jgi:hypothetical protein
MTIDSQDQPLFSTKESEKLAEFRKRVGDIIAEDEEKGEDHYLIRWLRARNLDVPKAEEMLRASMEWRKANQVDGILERDAVPDDIAKDAPFAWCGNTREGLPIFLSPMGKHDMRKFLEKYGRERCEQIQMINMEKISMLLKLLSEEQGKKITQFVEILDFNG